MLAYNLRRFRNPSCNFSSLWRGEKILLTAILQAASLFILFFTDHHARNIFNMPTTVKGHGDTDKIGSIIPSGSSKSGVQDKAW